MISYKRPSRLASFLTEALLILAWLIVLAGIVLGLLALTQSDAYGSTPRARTIVVLYSIQARQSVPSLPNSLPRRPRLNEPDPATGAAELSEDVVEERLAENADVQAMRWFFKNGLSRYHIVIASAPNCPPCKAADAEEYAELMRRHWYVYKLDVSRSPALAEWLDVTVTPTTIAFVDGREVGRIEGRASAAKITALFTRFRHDVVGEPAVKRRGGDSTSCLKYRGRWTWPGGTIASLRSHLCRPPHNYERELVYSLSPGQCIQIHDRWHDLNGPWPPQIQTRRFRRTSVESGVFSLAPPAS